jgi:predicted amidohydrolase
MNPDKSSESMATVQVDATLAKAKKAAITGSVVIEDQANYYNRMLFVFFHREIQFYDKRHLFCW